MTGPNVKGIGVLRPSSLFMKTMILITMVAFVGMTLVPPQVFAQADTNTKDEDIARRFEDVMVLKSRGEYDNAIDELHTIMADYEGSERVAQLAYSYLVATYHEKGDTEGARRIAAEALEKYPDLTAREIITVPPSVDEYYDTLRREMFGAIEIVEPEGARAFLDQKSMGDTETPLRLGLVRVGEHDLRLTKPGYHDYTERVAIRPNGNLIKTIQMKRARDRKWWGVRIGVVVVAVVAAYFLFREDTQKDLPAPPAPP